MKKTTLFLAIVCILFLPSCIYKMPDEDSYSLIPRTNNQVFIGDRDANVMPNQAAF